MANSSVSEQTYLFPGPSFHIDLAALDARHPVHYSRRLLIFRCPSPTLRDAQLAALKTGLQALVERCPILGGTIVSPPPGDPSHGLGDWRTIVCGPGLELVMRDLSSKIPSFERLEADDFQPHNFPCDLLIPVPEDIDNDIPFAACKMQYSAIEGGTILTWAMSHSVADGSGNNELIGVLAEETRLAEELSSKNLPSASSKAGLTTYLGENRSVMRNMKSDVEFKIEDHPGFRWPTPSPSGVPVPLHPFEATAPEIPVLLRISPAGLAQLKIDATIAGSPPISTHDALSALIWRTALLIRSIRSASAQEVPLSTNTSIFMPSDGRRHLSLPSTYIGNAVYQLTANLDLGTLLSPTGLGYAASAVRSAIKAVTPALVSSYVAKTNEVWVDWQFMNGTASTTGVAMGTDWTSGVLYGQDWGKDFGPLIRYRYPGEAFNCIYPKLPDGTAEVMMGVLPGEGNLLKSEHGFGKYIDTQ
ncbi:uncharacterized protein PAC_15716 [Phialocephala subalpina]|uniref:Trichothecene 3-O-acetyltransferase n=1 Tax=Phialocephala subalpina TaxID=576137 RepID=A0A1L7XLK0_9HELO|nr:uncharacterized protein PAC_15716 [Phialocephala subalpina]